MRRRLRRPSAVLLHGRAAVLAAVLLLAFAGCGGGGGSGNPDDVRVVYLDFGGGDPTGEWLRRAADQFERQHPDATVELVGVTGSVSDYYTRVALMQRSESEAPEVVLEDSGTINQDVAAGYLLPLDGYLAGWPDWAQFADVARTATRATDGQTYGVLVASDTRALWYNADLLRQAGVPVPWQPATWADVLAAARAVKRRVSGVIPLNLYAGKPAGEAAAMQGLEMLLSGTRDTLYDAEAGAWVTASPGLRDSVAFYQTVFSEELTPPLQQALSPNLPNLVAEELLPAGELAIALDGSWLPRTWLDSGTRPWPEWTTTMRVAPMPTQHGEPPGRTSMSGGFSLAIGANAQNPDGAWAFMATALDRDNTQWVTTTGSLTTVRADVAAMPAYRQSNPTVPLFTDLISDTHFRPTLPEYPAVSAQIQEATELIATGQATAAEALDGYAQGVARAVGADRTTTR